MPIRLMVSESRWPAASVSVSVTVVKPGPKNGVAYVWATAAGGSVGQLPLAAVPSPKSIDQPAMSSSGSVLLAPRSLKVSC